MGGRCVRVVPTLPGRGVHLTFTLTFRILPFGVLKAYSKQGYLGWGVPMDHSLWVWSPVRSGLHPSPLGFSPGSASVAFSILKPLLVVVLVYQQVPAGALG